MIIGGQVEHKLVFQTVPNQYIAGRSKAPPKEVTDYDVRVQRSIGESRKYDCSDLDSFVSTLKSIESMPLKFSITPTLNRNGDIQVVEGDFVRGKDFYHCSAKASRVVFTNGRHSLSIVAMPDDYCFGHALNFCFGWNNRTDIGAISAGFMAPFFSSINNRTDGGVLLHQAKLIGQGLGVPVFSADEFYAAFAHVELS